MRSKRRILSICFALLVIVPVMAMLSMSPNGASSPYDIGNLQFRQDGTFKILQLADIQHDAAISDNTKKFINALIIKNRPDLIVLTGDQVSRFPILGSGSPTTTINSIMTIFNHYGIPVAAVYGNHDGSVSSKSSQLSTYQSWSSVNLMVGTDPEYTASGYSIGSERLGNYNIPIKRSNGTPYGYNLWFFDTGGTETGNYEGATQSAVNWYKWKSNQLKARNNNQLVPSIVFQHIMVPDIGSASIPNNRNNNPPPAELNYASKAPPAGASISNFISPTQFAQMKTQGDVKAIFVGHDHENNFRYNKDGIDLVSTGGVTDQGASAGSYQGTYRCGRTITLYEDNPNYIKTETDAVDGDSNVPAAYGGNLNSAANALTFTGNHIMQNNWETVTPATCTAAATQIRRCAASPFCTYTETRTSGAALNHNPGAWTQTIAPTCIAPGEQAQKCTRCGIVINGPLPLASDPNAHVPGPWVQTITPTCTMPGEKMQQCGLCGNMLNTPPVAVDPAGHDAGEWIRTLEPTDTTPGEDTLICTKCGAVQDTRPVPPIATHTPGPWVQTKAPTCTEEGIEVQYCQDCVEHELLNSRSIAIDPTAHDAGSMVVTLAPNCTTDGSKELQCTRCHAQLGAPQTIPADGTTHDAGAWSRTIEPTTTTTGLDTLACTRCGAVLDTHVVPKLNPTHTPGPWVQTKAPNCTEEGIEVQYCQDCAEHEILDSRTIGIDSTAHDAGVWGVKTAPACTTAGVEALRCTRCAAELNTRAVAALGHNPGAWTRTLAPTCIAQGAEEQRCTRCNVQVNTRMVAIDPTAHSFGSWVRTKEPTTTSEGEDTRTCTRTGCGVQEKRAVAKLNPQPGPKKIFTTRYDSNFGNWLMFIFLFGWIWMWF